MLAPRLFGGGQREISTCTLFLRFSPGSRSFAVQPTRRVSPRLIVRFVTRRENEQVRAARLILSHATRELEFSQRPRRSRNRRFTRRILIREYCHVPVAVLGKFVVESSPSRQSLAYPSPSISAEHFRPGVFARSKGTNLLAAK